MKLPTFAEQRASWSNPPVDDVGYIPAQELLAMGDEQFASLMNLMWHNRYEGWRNYRGRWVELFGMHEGGISGKRVLDYGCGVGMEGVQYATLGNKVWLADIVPENLKVAKRLFGLYGLKLSGALLITGRSPFLRPSAPIDVIHCMGVLHHIPKPEPVVQAMHGWLGEGGVLHLMLYSNRAWKMANGVQPPVGPVEDDPGFEQFVRRWDGVGGYADWYDRDKLVARFGEWFTVERYEPLTRGGEYVGAILRKR